MVNRIYNTLTQPQNNDLSYRSRAEAIVCLLRQSKNGFSLSQRGKHRSERWKFLQRRGIPDQNHLNISENHPSLLYISFL